MTYSPDLSRDARTARETVSGSWFDHENPVVRIRWVDVAQIDLAAAEGRLDTIERARADNYLRNNDRARFVTAAASLRAAIAEDLNMDEGDVRIDRACVRCAEQHGKPRLPGTDLRVSVSHSGGVIVIASAKTADVGVDVEAVVEDYKRLTRLVLGEGEQALDAASFTQIWCRKESVVKATGHGIAVGLRGVLVGGVEAAPRLTDYPAGTLAATMVDLRCPAGYAAALTVLGKFDDIRVVEVRPFA